jgi:putative ABC transport system permease protein
MSALGRVVRSGVGRRRVQTTVIGPGRDDRGDRGRARRVADVASSAPFDRAFGQQHGAHLTVQFDAAKATVAQISASAQAAGVTATAGPFPTAVITPADDRPRPTRPITVAGRSAAAGAVDAVTLTAGRWVAGPGEIVLYTDGRLPPGVGRRSATCSSWRTSPATSASRWSAWPGRSARPPAAG